MTRREPKALGNLLLARIEGQRWCVAMCDTEWATFTDVIDLAAQRRLHAVLDFFCDYGEADLPPGSFRWLTPASEAARVGAFEAHGVVVTGRAAVSGDRQTFFVTAIAAERPQESPRRKARDNEVRQGELPLQITQPERN